MLRFFLWVLCERRKKEDWKKADVARKKVMAWCVWVGAQGTYMRVCDAWGGAEECGR